MSLSVSQTQQTPEKPGFVSNLRPLFMRGLFFLRTGEKLSLCENAQNELTAYCSPFC